MKNLLLCVIAVVSFSVPAYSIDLPAESFRFLQAGLIPLDPPAEDRDTLSQWVVPRSDGVFSPVFFELTTAGGTAWFEIVGKKLNKCHGVIYSAIEREAEFPRHLTVVDNEGNFCPEVKPYKYVWEVIFGNYGSPVDYGGNPKPVRE